MNDRVDLLPARIACSERRCSGGRVGRCMLLVAAAALLTACAAIALDAPRVLSHAFDQPLQTSLGRTYFPRLASTSSPATCKMSRVTRHSVPRRQRFLVPANSFVES